MTVPWQPSPSMPLAPNWPALQRRWRLHSFFIPPFFLLFLVWPLSPLQGTVIRVFSIPEGQRLFEFRRGMKRLALTFILFWKRINNLPCLRFISLILRLFMVVVWQRLKKGYWQEGQKFKWVTSSNSSTVSVQVSKSLDSCCSVVTVQLSVWMTNDSEVSVIKAAMWVVK